MKFLLISYPLISDATKKSGQRLVGDVDYNACKKVAGWITPVPGGIFLLLVEKMPFILKAKLIVYIIISFPESSCYGLSF